MKGFEIKCLDCGKTRIVTSHLGLSLESEITLEGEVGGEVYIECKCGNKN